MGSGRHIQGILPSAPHGFTWFLFLVLCPEHFQNQRPLPRPVQTSVACCLGHCDAALPGTEWWVWGLKRCTDSSLGASGAPARAEGSPEPGREWETYSGPHREPGRLTSCGITDTAPRGPDGPPFRLSSWLSLSFFWLEACGGLPASTSHVPWWRLLALQGRPAGGVLGRTPLVQPGQATPVVTSQTALVPRGRCHVRDQTPAWRLRGMGGPGSACRVDGRRASKALGIAQPWLVATKVGGDGETLRENSDPCSPSLPPAPGGEEGIFLCASRFLPQI